MKRTIKPTIYQVFKIFSMYPKLRKYIKNTKYTLDDKYELTKKYTEKSLKNLKLDVKVIGKENIPNGNVLFVANHTNYTDFYYIISAVDKPVGFIIAKEYDFKKIPIINQWMQQLNCLFLDRSNSRQGLKTIIQASKQLKDTTSMCVFPEGTTHNEGVLGEFKDGAFKMAFKSNVPIVPIVIKGAKDSFSLTKEKFLGIPVCEINPKEIEVEVLPAIYDHIENNKIKTFEVSNKIENLMKEKLIEFNNSKEHLNGI